jgi:hypothetical protein
MFLAILLHFILKTAQGNDTRGITDTFIHNQNRERQKTPKAKQLSDIVAERYRNRWRQKQKQLNIENRDS